MSKALRETKCLRRSASCAGQTRPPVQRRIASPSGRTALEPHSGQVSGKVNPCLRRPLVDDYLDDLRDDVAGPLDDHGVADADVLLGDVVLVVQRRPADDDTAHGDGGEPGDGGEGPGAPDLDADVLDHGQACSAANLWAMAQRGVRPT